MGTFISILIRFRWLLFVASLALLVFSAAGLRHFTFDGSPRAFFSDGDPEYERFEAMEETYGSDYRIFFMLFATEGSMMDPENLRALQQMTEKAWELPYARRVDSLSNYQYTYSHDDELFVEDFFGDSVVNDPDTLAERQKVALNDPAITQRLVSADGKHAAVIIALTITNEQLLSGEGLALVKQAYGLADSIKAQYPNITTAATSSLLSTVYNMEVAASDMSLMIPVMFGLMFLILGLLLRSFWSVVVALFIAIASSLGAIGFASWLGLTFSVVSINAVIISIIVAVAHCIHIFTQLLKDMQTLNKKEALANSLRVNFFAVSVSTLTTLIGFLSLNTNDLPPAVTLGNVSAIGAVLAWLFSLTLLPALVTLFPFKPTQSRELLIDRVMDKLALFLIKRKYAVLLFMIALSAIMITLSFRNDLNDNLVETLHEPHIFRSDTALIDKHFGAVYIYSYNLDADGENNAVDPDYLKNMDKFATYLRAQPEVSSVHAFSDVIKRLNKSMHNDDPAYYSIPDDRELIAQYLLLYEMSLPFGLDLNEQLTPDRSHTLMTVSMPVLDTKTDIELDQRFWAWQKENLPPHMQDRNIAIATIWSYLTIHSLTNSLQGSATALVLISFVMLLMLRSLRYGVISLAPNIIPAMFGFGVWYLYSGRVGLGLTCVTIITIGIVVDDTVHFLVKYQKALKDFKGDAELAIRATFKQVGPALFVTTAVLAAGFGVLGLSQIIINSALGQVTAVILLAAFLLDILLLPVLLLIFDRNRKHQYAEQNTAALKATDTHQPDPEATINSAEPASQ